MIQDPTNSLVSSEHHEGVVAGSATSNGVSGSAPARDGVLDFGHERTAALDLRYLCPLSTDMAHALTATASSVLYTNITSSESARAEPWLRSRAARSLERPSLKRETPSAARMT